MGPFLIIYGTRGVTYGAGDGNFHCPDCGEQPYRQKRVRRFFTLYFIPLIPLDKLGEYVECGRCQGTFDLEVLHYDPHAESAATEAAFRVAIRRVMSLICLADGVIDDSEVQAIRTTYEKLTSCPMSDDEARREIASARQADADIATYLRSIAGTLNDPGKEMIVRSALLIAAADGEYQEEEKELVATIGEALLMTSSHVNGVTADVFGTNANLA